MISVRKKQRLKNRQQEIEKQNQQQKDINNDRGMGGMSLQGLVCGRVQELGFKLQPKITAQ